MEISVEQSYRMSSNCAPKMASHCVEDRPVEINRSNRSDDSIGMDSIACNHDSFRFLQEGCQSQGTF